MSPGLLRHPVLMPAFRISDGKGTVAQAAYSKILISTLMLPRVAFE